MKTYLVSIKFQFPAWDYKQGLEYEVHAKNKRDAIYKARGMAGNDGHLPCRGMGKAICKAVEV